MVFNVQIAIMSQCFFATEKEEIVYVVKCQKLIYVNFGLSRFGTVIANTEPHA